MSMKLEDIKKKNIYTVPDKYFDQLPARIQSRANENTPVSWFSLNWSLSYKLAAPVLAVILIMFYFGRNDQSTPTDAESLLAMVSTDEIIAYIDFMDISTDEIIETIDLTDFDFMLYEDNIIDADLEIDELEHLYDAYGFKDELL